MSDSYCHKLIREFLSLPSETEWLEFKANNENPEEIGRNISALANASALHGRQEAYLVWGIEDKTHQIVGTGFNPKTKKIGNEEFENWLIRLLTPRLDIRFDELDFEGKMVVILKIPATFHTPVRFKREEYIRVGSYTKKLHEYPEKERALWKSFEGQQFETGLAARNVTEDFVLDCIDYPKFCKLLGYSLPDNRSAILKRLVQENVIVACSLQKYHITNLGAILFSLDLSKFENLQRKAVRVIIYSGTDRTQTKKEQLGNKGYAIGFESLINYINDQLPQNEEIGRALRQNVKMYPEITIRELVANALIHQDFTISGTGPTIEIFDDRMEITNPGCPLIDPLRFIDEPPRSRNEKLAGLMRRMNICEERGSGIDKTISAVEKYQLPAPDFLQKTSATVAVLYAYREFRKMDKQDRIRACYQHACLRIVSNQRLNNASLRARLGIADSNYPMASRIIRDTIETGLIKPYSSGASKKDTSYVPFWA